MIIILLQYSCTLRELHFGNCNVTAFALCVMCDMHSEKGDPHIVWGQMVCIIIEICGAVFTHLPENVHSLL